MATKVLITPKNSVWGVIVNPQSSNTYRHALSFDTPELKKAFIDQELCEGKDYKALLAAQPEISLTRISATTAIFTVTPDQYQDETFLTLLNKDFCIIEEDGVEQFYTLSGVRDPDLAKSIVFTAELDIFFTYDIKDGVFNDKDVDISRAMSDRFVKDDQGNIIPIYEDLNKKLKTPFFNADPIDSSITSELRVPSDIGKNIYPKITHMLEDESQEEKILQIINNLNWYIFYTSLDKTAHISWAKTLIQTGGSPNTDPIWLEQKGKIDADSEKNYALAKQNLAWYAGVITCSDSTTIVIDGTATTYTFQIKLPSGLYGPGQAEDSSLQDAATFKTSLQPLPHHPFTHFNGFGKDLAEFKLDEKLNILQLEFKQPYLDEKDFRPLGCIEGPTSQGGTAPLHFTVASTLYPFIQDSSVNYPIYPSTPFIPDPSNPFNIKNEIRLNISPYTKIRIGSSTKTTSLLNPEYFSPSDKKQIKFRQTIGYMLEAYSTSTEFLEYENIYNRPNPRDNLNIFEDIANYSLPTVTDAFNEYIARNKATLNTNMLKSVGSGVLGIGAAAAAGPIGLVAGIGALASSIGNIASQAAMIKDLKNSPDKLNATGSTLLLDMKTKQITPYIQRLVLYPQMELLIAQHFYKFGYSFKDEFVDINSLLKSRYWFNYIQAEETFENIILQASSEIKQLINDTLSSGLTIWHVRDLATFKGIKSYTNENVEMSLLTVQNDEVNDDNRKEK